MTEHAMLIGLAAVAIALIVYIIIYRTLSRCCHRWHILEVHDLEVRRPAESPPGSCYVLRCCDCGAISKKEVLGIKGSLQGSRLLIQSSLDL